MQSGIQGELCVLCPDLSGPLRCWELRGSDAREMLGMAVRCDRRENG